MALKSIIFKAALQVNDLDRHHYGSYALTVARHPSETDERMMVRILAFALQADDALSFGQGLSSDEEPDLWLKDLTGAIQLWVEVGLPDVKALRKAAGRSAQVALYAYGKTTEIWWRENRSELERIDQLSVHRLHHESSQALGALAQRNMELHCTIQDGAISLSGENGVVDIAIATLKPAATSTVHTRTYTDGNA